MRLAPPTYPSPHGEPAHHFEASGIRQRMENSVHPLGLLNHKPCMMWPRNAHTTRPRRAYGEGAS